MASLVSYRPLARGLSAREPWKPRPGDGISSNWLIAELTHRQAHGSNSQWKPTAGRHPRPIGAWRFGAVGWRNGRMRAWPHRPKTNLGAPTASSSDLVLGYRSP